MLKLEPQAQAGLVQAADSGTAPGAMSARAGGEQEPSGGTRSPAPDDAGAGGGLS